MVKEAIARYISERGIKQVFIAQKTGMTPQAVNAMVRGERNLDVEEYAAICVALGVPYDTFFPNTNAR